jgi:hypothetical protein
VGRNLTLAARARGRWWGVIAPAAGLALVLVGAPVVGAQDVGYTSSVFVARTAVPGATFDGVYLFNSVDVGRGPVRVMLSVPWVRQHTVTDAYLSGIDGSEVPAADTTAAGFGDPLLRGDVRLIDKPASALQVGVAGAVKFPAVGPETGRGTGEFDAAAGVSAYKGLGRTSLLIDALYWKYGDPDTFDFQDTLSYSLAVARMLGATGRWSTMLSLSGFSAGYDGMAPPAQFNISMLRLVGRRQSLSVSASFGLTESATDFSVGTSWRITK